MHVPHKGTLAPLTPHIDALAAAAVVLEKVYTFDRCAPSRASLLTGRLPVHVTQMNPSIVSQGGGIPLDPDMPTMAEKFQEAGYQTALIGAHSLTLPQAHWASLARARVRATRHSRHSPHFTTLSAASVRPHTCTP